jgi:imidazolonepropionase-like amidohydrolase
MTTDDALWVMTADRVVDGTGRAARAGTGVGIRGSRIAELGPVEALAGRPEVRRLSFPGCTILPGLVDSHSHLTFSAGPVPLEDIQAASDAQLVLRAAAHAREALLAGVTTVRDLGGRDRTTLELRDAIAAGLIPGPRLYVAGRPITIPGGHCHFLGGVAQGVKAVRALAEELIAEGVDVVKVMATGGNMTVTSDPLAPQFTRPELQAVVEVATAHGRRVTAHARGVEGIRVAVEAGVHNIEHSRMEVATGRWGFDEDLARLMADRGVTATVTMAASYRAFQRQEAGGAIGLRPGAIPIPVRQENARRLRQAGVRVVVGTDAGAALSRFDEAAHVEMELLAGAGWSPDEALEAGTLGAAAAMGLERELGSLEPGKQADLVVVRGDPTRNISDVRQVECVVLGGRVVARAGQLTVDARAVPWPVDDIAHRPGLTGLRREARRTPPRA